MLGFDSKFFLGFFSLGRAAPLVAEYWISAPRFSSARNPSCKPAFSRYQRRHLLQPPAPRISFSQSRSSSTAVPNRVAFCLPSIQSPPASSSSPSAASAAHLPQPPAASSARATSRRQLSSVLVLAAGLRLAPPSFFASFCLFLVCCSWSKSEGVFYGILVVIKTTLQRCFWLCSYVIVIFYL